MIYACGKKLETTYHLHRVGKKIRNYPCVAHHVLTCACEKKKSETEKLTVREADYIIEA